MQWPIISSMGHPWSSNPAPTCPATRPATRPIYKRSLSFSFQLHIQFLAPISGESFEILQCFSVKHDKETWSSIGDFRLSPEGSRFRSPSDLVALGSHGTWISAGRASAGMSAGLMFLGWADLKVQWPWWPAANRKPCRDVTQNVYWYSLIGSNGCKSPIIGCIPCKWAISSYIRLYPIPIHSWLLLGPSVPGWFRMVSTLHFLAPRFKAPGCRICRRILSYSLWSRVSIWRRSYSKLHPMKEPPDPPVYPWRLPI